MSFDIVNENLLLKNNLEINKILSLLHSTNTKYIDYADLYFQSNYYEMWVLENSIIKNGIYNVDQGIGIRCVQNEKTGFSYTNQLDINSLIQEFKTAQNIILDNNQKNITEKNIKKNKFSHHKNIIQNSSLYSNTNPLNSLSEQNKIELLMKIDQTARKNSKYVEEVIACLSGKYEEVLIIGTDGTLSADIRPLVHLSITIQVEYNGKREQGKSGGGARCGYEFFLDVINTGETRALQWTKEAVKMALTNISAIEAPAGSMPVILGPGWPGILLHEAVGHGLEGDFNRYGTSLFAKQVGNQVTSELCTIVDDGTIQHSRGSLKIDDEGVPGKYNVLIEDGILKKYMQDKLNAKLTNMSITGNGRRESYAYLPMPRMTNTYMLPGKSTKEEIIDSVNYGIYALNFSGGQVDITSGKFVFSTSKAFLIKKGKITKPIKGATLIGSGIDIMQQISMIGNDLSLDPGVGICIKNGQSVPVNVGQPTVKINKITIGGTI